MIFVPGRQTHYSYASEQRTGARAEERVVSGMYAAPRSKDAS